MIQVYEVGHTDYSSMGMGTITPAHCVVHEEQGGAYELELTHPMDDRLIYDLLMAGRVLRVPVPAATTPMYKILGTPDKEYYKAPSGGVLYSAKSTNVGYTETVTKTQTRRVMISKAKPKVAVHSALGRPVVVRTGTTPAKYKTLTDSYTEDVWVPGDSSVVAQVGPGTDVIILDKSDPSWTYVSVPSGATGWIQAGLVVLDRVVPGTPDETVQGEKIRDQLFRIYRVEKDTSRLEIKAWARHISYDLIGNVVMAAGSESITLDAVLNQLRTQVSQPGHGFAFYTDQPAMLLTEVDYRHKNIIEALMDPEEGILAKGNLRLVRDNHSFYLTNASQQVRAPLTYGRNLMGVQLDLNEDAVVNRIIPLGQNKDGDPVLIDAQWVDSPRNTEETFIRAKAIEYSEAREKDATDDDPGMTLEQVKAKLLELAQAEYEQGVDLPDIEMSIDFLQLGDTEEYEEYRDLDRLYLADLVQITDLVNGIDVEAEVTEYDYDCLSGRYTKLGVGVTSAQRTIGSIGSFMLPDGSIGGRKLVPGSIDGSRIAYMSIGAAKIGLAAIDSAHIKWAAIKEAHIEDASVTRAKIAEAAIGSAEIEDAAIQRAHIGNGVIEDAHIGTAGIDFARIRDLAAGTAVITEGFGGKLLIDRLAVSEANIVSLTAGRLIVQGTSGALYQLTVDVDGQVITELRQIGNDDIANVSLNAGEKLIKSSITADLLNVQEIFASEALIGAIKAHNIEAHSIGVDQLTPGLFEDMITNATGQQLVVEFSHGTILDRERTQTIARIRVFHIGVEITDRMPDNAISWERISEDPAGDAVWNAFPAHQNTKTVTINAADVNFRGVLRCKVNEARLYAEPSINDNGELLMTDYGDGDSLNFSIVSADLIYNGNTAYEVRYGELFTDMLIGAFHLDTQMSNLKTSYVDISRHGIEMYSDGYLNLILGSKFNMRAGSGAKSIGLSNDHALDYFAWAGASNPASAPFYVKMDGTVRATKLQLDNSNIIDFTQHYAYDDADNASPTHPMLFDVFIPSEYSGIQSMKLTFKAEPFRAYSTGAASGGGTTVTSASGGGAAPTSRSGGGGTETSSSKLVATTQTGLITKSDGPGATKGSNSAYTGFTTVSSLGNQHQHTMSHTHNIDNHTHAIDAHTHGTEAHSHTVSFPAHTHIVDVPAHSHSVTLAAHTHGIEYGIYQGTTASAVQVHVDGTYIGSFASLTARDITAHLSKSSGKIIRDAWHTVTLTPNTLTRLRAQVFVIGVVSQAQAAIY